MSRALVLNASYEPLCVVATRRALVLVLDDKAELVKTALASAPRPVHLNAQSHLVEWYARFGFVVDGTEFVEDGIPHTPLVLTA